MKMLLAHKSFLLVVCLFLFFGHANQGLALFDAQLLVGMEDSQLEGDVVSNQALSLSGTQKRGAFHLDPIPLLPVGFGLGVGQSQLEGKDSADQNLVISGLLLDFELMAWSPISLWGFTPYAKLGYLLGAYQAESQTSVPDLEGSSQAAELKYVMGSTGYLFAAGLRYSLLPFVGLLVEVSTRQEEGKASEAKLGGQSIDIAAADSMSLSATQIMLGLQVGL